MKISFKTAKKLAQLTLLVYFVTEARHSKAEMKMGIFNWHVGLYIQGATGKMLL